MVENECLMRARGAQRPWPARCADATAASQQFLCPQPAALRQPIQQVSSLNSSVSGDGGRRRRQQQRSPKVSSSAALPPMHTSMSASSCCRVMLYSSFSGNWLTMPSAMPRGTMVA